MRAPMAASRPPRVAVALGLFVPEMSTDGEVDGRACGSAQPPRTAATSAIATNERTMRPSYERHEKLVRDMTLVPQRRWLLPETHVASVPDGIAPLVAR